MSRASPVRRIRRLILTTLVLLSTSVFGQKPFEIFEDCTLVPQDWADGDSFMVKLPDGRQEVFRLYYVDCIETGVADDNDRRRLREQGRYFGVEDFRELVNHGHLATDFRRRTLEKPFT